MRITIKTIIAALLFLLATQASASADLADAAKGLLSKKYSDKIQATEAIAASGGARSAFLLETLLEGDLYAIKSDDRLVSRKKVNDGYQITDIITEENLGVVKSSDLSKIRINNKMRGLIKDLLGRLTLLNEDPALRLKAADSVFKSRPKEMIVPLGDALEAETDATVAAAMRRALAALNFVHGDTSEVQAEALLILEEQSNPEVKSLLSAEANRLAAIQNPSPENQALAKAVGDALAKVDEKLAMLGIVENVFQGISLGSVLLLAAIGLAITFGVMGVINMAHGEMVMIGAYTTYVVQELCRNFAPDLLVYSLVAAIPAAFIVSGLCGVAIERSIIRFLYGRPLETLLATWGLSLILQQFVRTIFGPTNKEVSSPDWLSGTWEITGGLALTYNRIAIIFFAAAVLLMLMLVLRKTAFGLQMRAVTQNRRMASSMGIRTGWVDAMTFGLGSGVAGMAGVALSQIDNVSPNLGQAYIVDSFMVVVFGGVGNLWGTLVGALSLGVTNKFLEPYTGAVLAKIFILVFIILFIQKRPRGLFALKGRAVEN
ncbi:urea ABC transporter permease subunit UrtB [Sneathiella sp. HT1-7]|jgi:urea transport system permease protein|uniref:urea ABC transporter permease subunit UrtB n=1 Tax=Sneathiella sp. HT1-7 TaxID=2887192 RepID=UPI001D13D181|nr:urea ABC transporter permease subunit UrtB [Sneathiella sp. HT1-7]MCC3303694.1 urea ABC transporter permease subunit UrtB [Sneathiella sp. HT1-7]